MKMTWPRPLVNGLAAGFLAAGCARASVAPAARGGAVAASGPTAAATPGTTQASGSGAALPAERPGAADADVRFMQRMLAHHAQALAMTALVPTRSERSDLEMLAERITVSQRDEMAFMRRWLTERHHAVPATDGAHGAMEHGAAQHGQMQHRQMQHGQMEHAQMEHGAMRHDSTPAGAISAPMPGMATADDMARLAAASGAAFDALFLQLMIRHHEGALKMVADYFSTRGAGQEPEAFRFVSDVDADQRAEIARMRALLARSPQ